MTKVASILLLSLSTTFAFVQPRGSFNRPRFELRRNDEAVLSPGSPDTAATIDVTNQNDEIFSGILNQEQFLQEMEQQREDLKSLSHQYATLNHLNLVVDKQANTYLGSVERLSRLADESSAKYSQDLTLLGFQKKTQGAVIEASRGTINDSSKAFVLLAIAIAAGTLATSSPTVIGQLSTFDIPTSLHFDGLPTTFGMPEMNTEFIAQNSAFEHASQFKDDFMEPLSANIAAMKESVMVQTSQTLDAVKDAKTTVFSSLYSWWSNAQAATSSQAEAVKESITAQVDGVQASAKDLQTTMTLQLRESQNPVPGLITFVKADFSDKASSAEEFAKEMQEAAAIKAFMAEEHMVSFAVELKQGLVDFLAQLRGVVEDAQYTLRVSAASSVKEEFVPEDLQNAIKEMQGSAKGSANLLPQFETPELPKVIDIGKIATLMQEVQSVVGAKATSIEIPQIIMPAIAADEPMESLSTFDIYRPSAVIEEFFRNR